ncbi:MAG: SxtJ family membrane protein [Longimicrobiales bacterium]
MAAGIPARLTPAEGRKFGLTVGGAFLALSLIMWWRGHQTLLTITLTLGVLLVLAGLLIPGQLGPVYRGWMKFGLVLSKVTTPIFMGVVFFIVITPIGLIRRLATGNTLIPKRTTDSYWHARPEGQRRGNLKRQF